MSIRLLFLQLCCGGAGGYVAGAGFSRLSCGCVRDFLIGLAGGVIGGQLLQRAWGCDVYTAEMEIFLSSTIGGCAGGAVLVVIMGGLRTIIRKP